MEHIANKLQRELLTERKKGSEHNETLKLIEAFTPMTPKYNYGFWRKWISRSKVSYVDMLGILKQLESLPDKYNKGAVLFNKLKKRWTISKSTVSKLPTQSSTLELGLQVGKQNRLKR